MNDDLQVLDAGQHLIHAAVHDDVEDEVEGEGGADS